MIKITIPINPKPQSRPRFTRNGRPYELKDMKVYREAVSLHCKQQFKHDVIADRPIAVITTFYIEPPKYVSKVKKNAVALKNEQIRVFKKPDIDNYVKAIFDSMSGIVFKDDGVIAYQQSEKFYSLNPRTEIVVLEEHEIADYVA